MAITYRACYWQSTDGQGEVVLTSPEHDRLSDEDLTREAREEAARAGISLDGGQLVIGKWTA